LLYYTPPLQANILKSQIDNRLILDKNQSIELYPFYNFNLVLKVSSRLIVFLEFEISDIVIDILYSGAEEARDNPENCLKLNNAFL
jgi:hypothetical protein